MAKTKAPTKKLRKEFFKAFGGDNVTEVAKYLDGGLDPNTMFQLDNDEPALVWALHRELHGIAQLLLDRGADVKLASPRGKTALHAVRDADLARTIVERGADVDARDAIGRTPLHAAADEKVLSVVEALVAAGADIDAADDAGMTPYACAQHAGVRAFLRGRGAKTFGPGGGRVIVPASTAPVARGDVELARGCIACDRAGNVWMWSYSGLYRFDGTTVTRTTFEETFAVSAIVPAGDAIYFATNWGLLRVKGDEWRLYSSADSELFDDHLTFGALGPDGRVYLLAYEGEEPDKHIIIFDGEQFSTLAPGKDYPPGLEMERIVFDSHGEMMLAGRGGYAFKRSGAWVHTAKLDPKSPFGTSVYDIIDDGDAIWFGTQQGVFERRGDDITKHDTKNLAKHLLKDGDTIWVGTYFGGLARIRGGEVTIFDEKTSALPEDDVQGLARGADGTIWVHAGSKLALVRGDQLERFE